MNFQATHSWAELANRRNQRISAVLVILLHVLLLFLLMQGLAPRALRQLEPDTVPVDLLPLLPPPPPVQPHLPQPRVSTPSASIKLPVPERIAPSLFPSLAPPLPDPAAAPEPNPAPSLPPSLPPSPRIYDLKPLYMPPVEELQQHYPRRARREGVSGRVLVRLKIGADGLVREAMIRHAIPPGIFDALTLDYVKRFRFAPSPETGERLVDQELVFKLEP